MTEYRAIRAEEWPDGLVLWNEVFEVGPWLFHSLHKGTEGRKWDHCAVAVEDGEIVSTVDMFLRERLDVDGRPVRVGCIGSVATHPKHRRKGHSARLIEMALDTMRREGCEWSFLFTGVPEHYARFGWKPVTVWYQTAKWKEDKGGKSEARRSEPSEAPELAATYDATIGRLPLAAVRTPLSWRYAQRARIARPERVLLRAGDSYAVVRVTDDTALLELAGENPDELDALILSARELGTPCEWVPLLVARTPAIDAALDRWFGDMGPEQMSWAMVRPIEGGRVDLDALFAHPQAWHHHLDDF